MRRVIVIIAVLVFSNATFATDIFTVPRYDGSLLFEANLDRLLKQIYDDLRTLIKPAEGRISSRFGLRTHPVLGIKRHHNGIDIACGVGTPIKAVLPGVVSRVGWNGGYGRLVEIEHFETSMNSRYAHLSKFGVRLGQKVEKGDTLGLSGDSGLVTGPHLHFELYKSGKVIDPDRILEKRIAASIPHL